MFKYIVALFMMVVVNVALAQDKNPGSGQGVSMNSGLKTKLLYIVNNNIYYEDITNINPDNIGLVFVEGDSFYVRRIYGIDTDTSLISKYFGQQRHRGIVFLFTNDRVQIITKKVLKKWFKNRIPDSRIVFKIDNEPLSDNLYELDKLNRNKIKKIYIVKEFKLNKWDTAEEDVFVLFVIKTKGG